MGEYAISISKKLSEQKIKHYSYQVFFLREEIFLPVAAFFTFPFFCAVSLLLLDFTVFFLSLLCKLLFDLSLSFRSIRFLWISHNRYNFPVRGFLFFTFTPHRIQRPDSRLLWYRREVRSAPEALYLLIWRRKPLYRKVPLASSEPFRSSSDRKSFWAF